MAKVEGNTNQVYRRKYFIDAANVLFSGGHLVSSSGESPQLSRVVDGSSVVLSKQPVMVHAGSGDRICVEPVRDGKRLKSIKITCPCGRHTEMDVEYEK